jgi:myo-inositol-1(or 4)-monophosphatase
MADVGTRADLRALLPVAREAVSRARRIIRGRSPGSVLPKGERDLVTDVDLEVEDTVRDYLARETPDIGVLGEEHGASGDLDSGLWWALDPVDGTANFARGSPLCAVSLGLVAGRRPVLAAIDLPFLDARYTAAEGLGGYLDDQRIRASPVGELGAAVISVGDFARGAGAETKNDVRLELLRRLGARAQRIRMFGSAAIDLAWVADGTLDATVILANLPWDTMAGTLLVREAGGAVLDEHAREHSADSSVTIATCPGLRDELMSQFRRASERSG